MRRDTFINKINRQKEKVFDSEDELKQLNKEKDVLEERVDSKKRELIQERKKLFDLEEIYNIKYVY